MRDIAYFVILGKPIIFYIGILTIVSLLTTATIGAMNRRRIRVIPFKWHVRIATVTIILALVHGALGLSAYL